MHPARPHNSPPGVRDQARRGATPVNESPTTSYNAPTSLPSIRQLHPYLPPSGPPQHNSALGEGSSYTYPTPPHFASHPGQPTQQLLGGRRASEVYDFDSGLEEAEQHGPPKKKRRRQALSCTECKRRKIKCDRSQPCAPCTRRGEQSRCQWHIVEPIEKYVTRAEYDELKARFDDLAGQVQRLLHSATAVPPYYQMGMQPNIPGAGPEAVPSYAAGSLLYQPMIAPQTYPHHLDASSSQASSQRYIKPEDTQISPRHNQGAMGSAASPGPPQPSPTQTRSRPKSPTSTAAKHSPLSLASITTPFHPDPHPKKCHAQTLMLGERLRPGSQSLEGPAVLSSEMAPLPRAHRQSQERRRRYTSTAPHHPQSHRRLCKCDRHREDFSIPHIVQSYHHGTKTGCH